MRKIINLGVAVVLGTLLASACSSKTAHPSDAKTANYTKFEKRLTLKQAHDLIVKAGEENGWRMTAFKENAVIAEKLNGDNAIATTVYFNENSFYVSPGNDDLEDAIEDALENTQNE